MSEKPDLETLARALNALPPPPADAGVLTKIVIRPERGERASLERARLIPGIAGGVEGDCQPRSYAEQPERYGGSQVSAIRSDVVDVLCGDVDTVWAGDNLQITLDLSTQNLPTGSRVRLGETVLEVTPKPHNGCAKFAKRFGPAAVKIHFDPRFVSWRLRGLFFRVIEGGEVAVGDVVEVMSRGEGGG